MNDMVMYFGIALMINTFLFIGQAGVCEINPVSCPEYYNYAGSLLNEFDSGNYTINYDVASELPTGQTSPAPNEGSDVFLDPLSVVKKWFEDKISYIEGFINAVPNALRAMGLPQEISFALGAVWFGMMLMLSILVIVGRN